jgi:hypothetical protein
MKQKAKKILLTRELHEVVIVRSRNNYRSFCAECLAGGDFVSLDGAVQLSGISTRELLRRVEAREIHAQEATNGLLLVCLKSLVENLREF